MTGTRLNKSCRTLRAWTRALLLAALSLLSLLPTSVQACAACYGQSDSPMAAGMNWGILSLLGVITSVLVGIAAFFVVLARKSKAKPARMPACEELQPVEQY